MTLQGLMREHYDGRNQRDIFSKLESFTLAERAREIGIYPFFQALDNNDGTVAQIYGQRTSLLGGTWRVLRRWLQTVIW